MTLTGVFNQFIHMKNPFSQFKRKFSWKITYVIRDKKKFFLELSLFFRVLSLELQAPQAPVVAFVRLLWGITQFISSSCIAFKSSKIEDNIFVILRLSISPSHCLPLI